MFDKQGIKAFVRKTLGCGCPAEVFEYIDCQYDKKAGGVLLRAKINIGNRLLIYIVQIGDTDPLEDTLMQLIEAGRSERDILGFNRLRLVLASDRTAHIGPIAEEYFRGINKDEKIHLHVVNKEDIPLDSHDRYSGH
jgi:hypothetical protein